MKDDKKKTETTEVEEEVVVVDEEELTEEDLDKASGGAVDPSHPPIIGPDGRVYPPCFD